jgi:RNA polymerase sigma-70 factor, ECF subfamily
MLSTELDAQLLAFAMRGRSAWPELCVPDEELARYVASRLSPGQSLAELEAGDLYLACAAARGDALAGTRVRELCLPRLAAALSSVGLRDAIDETAQQVFSELLLPGSGGRRGIEAYRGSGPLAAFVKVIALRTARRARQRTAREQPTDRDHLLERATEALDPELEGLKRKYREEFKVAFHTALATLTEREQNLLRYELEGA